MSRIALLQKLIKKNSLAKTSESSNTTTKTFYTNKLPPSTNLSKECYNKSAELSKKSIERNKGDHYEGDEPNPHPCLCENALGWDLKSCSRCYKDRGLIRLAEETRLQKQAQEEDRIQAEIQPHADRIHSLGITTEALIAFAHKHDCWNWTTTRVVRDIIVPATSDTRCRYGELPELKDCFGPATVFMSHCWGATFGDLIGAACHGARKDRVVWIDIFAVRQWPGNVADLDFRGVISKCDALVVSTSAVDGLKKYVYDGGAAFFATEEGKAAKKALPFCRLWCIVELTAAIILNVPIVVKGGSVTKSEGCVFALCKSGAFQYKCKTWTKNNDNTYNVVFEDALFGNEIRGTRDNVPTTEIIVIQADGTYEYGTYEYDTECIGRLMSNLQNMIDVDASECAVPADKIREMAVVRNLEGGSKGVNALILGVVLGAEQSIDCRILEIDACVCNEPESLHALNIPLGCEGEARLLAKKVLQAAGSGGRESVVKELLFKWIVKEDDDLEKERWLIQLIDDSAVLYYASDGGHVGVLETILEVVGINVNVLGSNGSTPLYEASKNGHTMVVEALLAAKDIDVNKKGRGAGTPLDIASENGHTKVVKALLAAKDIDVNQANFMGNTPLYCASKNGHTKIVKLLLAAKDINVNKDRNGLGRGTPLDIAILFKHKEIIQLLKDAGTATSPSYTNESGAAKRDKKMHSKELGVAISMAVLCLALFVHMLWHSIS
jgi:hypothetical protein